MKNSIQCAAAGGRQRKSPGLSIYPPHDFRTTVRFSLYRILSWVLSDISFIAWSCAGGGAGGVLTTDRRRPSHRWGDSETHPPSAPHWPALATSHWAAHVWTTTAPSEGKEGWGYSPNQMKTSGGRAWRRGGGAAPMLTAHRQIMKIMNEERKPEKMEKKGNKKEAWQETPYWTKKPANAKTKLGNEGDTYWIKVKS